MSDVFGSMFGGGDDGMDMRERNPYFGPGPNMPGGMPPMINALPPAGAGQPGNEMDMRERNPYLGPGPGMPSNPQQQPQQHQQYFQQMHKGMDSMSEALQQIEQMQMPGGQYGGGGSRSFGPFAGGNNGKFLGGQIKPTLF